MSNKPTVASRIAKRLPPLGLAAVLSGLMAAAASTFPGAAISWPAGNWLALGLGLAGIGVASAGVVRFRRAATTVDPRSPERSSTLVSSGVYRFTRNPMYLGFILLLAGWAVWLANAVVLAGPAAFALWMDRVQIPFEESAMESRFGPEFRAYCRSTRRWL